MSPLSKKAISTMIAYVLLISISLSLSVMVYGWLRFYVAEEDIPACSDGVNIIITDYTCVRSGTDYDGYLVIGLKNKGRFNVDGFNVRVNDRVGSDFGIYKIDDTGEELLVGGEVERKYYFNSTYISKDIDEVTVVEVQPFIMDGEKISCQSLASQKILCQD